MSWVAKVLLIGLVAGFITWYRLTHPIPFFRPPPAIQLPPLVTIVPSAVISPPLETSIPATPTSMPTRLPTITATITPPFVAPSVVLVDTPTQIKSGQEFLAQWRVDGLPGSLAQTTKLTINMSTADGSSTFYREFSSVALPHTFQATFQVPTGSGTAQLVATATVNGQMFQTEQAIDIVP